MYKNIIQVLFRRVSFLPRYGVAAREEDEEEREGDGTRKALLLPRCLGYGFLSDTRKVEKVGRVSFVN